MKVLRVKDTQVSAYDLDNFFTEKGVIQGDSFGISWKIKKKRKIRRYSLDHYMKWPCDDCGNITEITVRKGAKKVAMDNHFGPYHGIFMSDFV
jgi:hypothetical protein